MWSGYLDVDDGGYATSSFDIGLCHEKSPSVEVSVSNISLLSNKRKKSGFEL